MSSSPSSPTHPNPTPPSSLQSALQMEGPSPDPDNAADTQPARKRKKNGSDEGAGSEPRRLRRSHEACTRCRAKKIKCDSKHPRCTACATAGVVCAQEDRHRNTLTPRGHLERIELQLAQCQLLLKRHIPTFDLNDLEASLAREGIDPQPPAPAPGYAFQPYMAPGYPPNYPPVIYQQHGYPMPPPPPGYNPHIHPAFQQPYPPNHAPSQAQPAAAAAAAPRTVANDIKGQDPNSNDMSNTQSLAKNFGVSTDIISVIAANQADKEDLAVGSSGLTSGRDRSIHESTTPRDPAHWVSVTVRRGSNAFAHPPLLATVAPENTGALDIWLPKDRKMVANIVEVYFARLNIHRPVFARRDFDKALDDLYAGQMSTVEANPQHDPGFLCSFYLVLALGTLSDLNNRSVHHPIDIDDSPSQHLLVKKLMPPDWPEHDEFFERALSVKPDLRVTISSLQALILLHWYLYTERQGRTLWRLVGSLVRLSIELGLHHDPTTQINPTTKQRLFTEEECILRVKLWGIILIHDRGTSILLGRPLGIAPSDSNTPRPSRSKSGCHDDFSEHFELSHAVAEIQADIINSLYSPTRQKGDSIMRNATRVIKSMSEFRRSLPDKYQYYFAGTDDWLPEQKSKLVQEINEDEGLTLLKVGIARLLLLRALFSSTELHYEHRHKALIDAIVTAHNVIIVHSQLIRFPDIAFFTSPIPLHIAAMVILYGQMSNCERLPRQTAIEDVWLALDMLPRFRWRWERKDLNGGHPLIFELASHVMGVDLHAVKPATTPVLLSEPEWDEDAAMPSPLSASQRTSPTPANAYPPTKPYGPQPRGMNGTSPTVQVPPANGGKHLVDIPTGLFYPFFPDENGNPPAAAAGTNGAQQAGYGHILAAAATHGQHGSYGGQGSHDTFISEERNPTMHRLQWVNNMHQRPYAIPPST
ncbi:fungal-specific transcription factor domain-containing protein [Mycena maculata]|uniref:Fungal-specific transcription factor domain-containing protein n=1 Tax=Mycena maculata TaxID=230809 RepID=A0AAD7HQR8_9AGAR|nr:fungal-specific transcription factor domain-containing protein [Mycena maculata]